jgi:rod shape determining protein RodA
MSLYKQTINKIISRNRFKINESLWQKLHLDGPLLSGILVLICMGLAILYSGSNQNMSMVISQGIKFLFALVGMIGLAQISPERYRLLAPWLFAATVLLLIAVLMIGQTSQGAKRWLGIGAMRFQPSEIMKLAMPMMLAWFFHKRTLPPKIGEIIIAGMLLIIPFLLIAKQPDLGTAILILASGSSVVFLAGMSWRLLAFISGSLLAALPVIWHFLHDYQRNRVLTFLSPESDPLGKGYHIIQSKIAIGSGGFFGKGFLHGSQSHLAFLPEHATDFIFAVCGEELGFLGCFLLISIYIFIVGRCLYIASQSQDTFGRLLAGSLGCTFFMGVFINIGMVTGLLPVVGLPLPMVSYGGTAVMTSLIGIGIIMAIQTHRKLISG